jgi:hypothetical protein
VTIFSSLSCHVGKSSPVEGRSSDLVRPLGYGVKDDSRGNMVDSSASPGLDDSDAVTVVYQNTHRAVFDRSDTDRMDLHHSAENVRPGRGVRACGIDLVMLKLTSWSRSRCETFTDVSIMD